MTSRAHHSLQVALQDVDALITHAKSFSGGRRGAPTAPGVVKPGRPFTRAAVVMLASALEGYFEGLVKEMSGHLNLTQHQLKDVKVLVSKSHGMNVHHVNTLLAYVGMPFEIDDISWQNVPKGSLRKELSDLAGRRNQISHGTAPNKKNQVADIERWRRILSRLCDELDARAARHVARETGTSPW